MLFKRPTLNDLERLNRQVGELFQQNNVAKATAVAERALKVATSLGKGVHLLSPLNNLAQLYQNQRKFGESEHLFRQAIALAESLPGASGPPLHMLLHDLARVLVALERYDEADTLLTRALASARSASPGFKSIALEVAHARTEIGVKVKAQGDFSGAERQFNEALQLREQFLGAEHPWVAQSLSNLASVYVQRLQWGEAEATYDRALTARKNAQPTDLKGVGIVYDQLGLVYRAQGKLRAAEIAHGEARAIFERIDPAGGDLPIVLHNLALVYDEEGKHEQAVALYEQSVRLTGAREPVDERRLAGTIGALASALHKQGKYAEAEAAYLRALSILERVVGPRHHEMASILTNLGLLCLDQGRDNEAKTRCLTAMSILEATFGRNHPKLAPTLTVLGIAQLRTGALQESRKALERAVFLGEQLVADVFVFASELEKLTYLGIAQVDYFLFLNVVAQDSKSDSEAVGSALNAVLRRKGLVQHALAAERQALDGVADPEVVKLIAELQRVSTELAAVFVLPPGTDEGGRPARLRDLEATRVQLEKRLARSSGVYSPLWDPEVSHIQEVARALPAGSALIEYVSVPALTLATTSRDMEVGADRYLAFVLAASSDHTAQPRLVDLGPAGAIDRAIWSFRAQVARALIPAAAGDEAALTEFSRKVYELAFAPLLREIGDANVLYISTDGELNQMPLGALPYDAKHCVIERFELNYVSSGRDLLRFDRQSQNSGTTVVVADPDFDAQEAGAMSAERASDLDSVHWTRLPGTRVEGESIAQLFDARTTTLHLAKDATKERILSVVSPQRLHVATHGFFLEDVERDGMGLVPGVGGPTSPSSSFGARNPLLRSGLALAGANRSGAKSHGILTALEAASLRLEGTDLVVLSACETGVGQTRKGEGVFGLRRAFELAGARTVVLSLWSIADRETKDLMVNFYYRLKNGERKRAALRNAQLDFIKDSRTRHPYYWAAFVSVGEP